MKILLILPFLLLLPIQNPSASPDNPPITVLNSKWGRTRLSGEQANSSASSPAQAMIPQNRNFERNRRANTPPGERDPNLDTIDGRSAAMDRSVQQAREGGPLEGFEYSVKLRNESDKILTAIIWEYQLNDAGSTGNVSGRQFLCGVGIKPGKSEEFRVVTTKGPGDVVNVASLGNKSKESAQGKVLINFLEFSDGSVWQRKDWDSVAARQAFDSRPVKERVSSACYGL